jgi:hypothetical protein
VPPAIDDRIINTNPNIMFLFLPKRSASRPAGISITTRARANADTAQPTRAMGIENESAYWGRTGEMILMPSMTKPETSERFRIRNSRCFIYKNPIICVSNKLLSIIDLQGMPDELRRRKARKYPDIYWTS